MDQQKFAIKAVSVDSLFKGLDRDAFTPVSFIGNEIEVDVDITSISPIRGEVEGFKILGEIKRGNFNLIPDGSEISGIISSKGCHISRVVK